MEDLRILFFLYMIQSLLMTLAGCGFFGIKIELNKVFLISIIQGMAIWIIRGLYAAYQIPYGSHTLILAIVFCILLNIIFKLDWLYCLGITFYGFSLIMLGGGLVGVGISWSGLSVEYIFSNVWVHIAFGHIENTLLLLYIFLKKASGFSLATLTREISE